MKKGINLGIFEKKLVDILKENDLYRGVQRYNLLLDDMYKDYIEEGDSCDVIKNFVDSIKRMDKRRANNSPKLRGLKDTVSKEYYNFLRSLNMWDIGYIHCAVVVYLVLNYDNFSEDVKKESAELIYYLILEDDDIYSCLCDNKGNRLLEFKELLDESKEFILDSFLIDDSKVTQNTKKVNELLNSILKKDNVLLIVFVCLLNILKRNMISFVGNIKVKDELNDFKKEILNKVLVNKYKLKYEDNYIKNNRGWWD